MSPYYRIDLEDYRGFSRPYALGQLTREHEEEIRADLADNDPFRYPFFIQANGRPRTVQGAYLTRCSPPLFELIMNSVGELIAPAKPSSARPAPIAVAPPYTLDEFLAEAFIERTETTQILEVWSRKRNLILEGPPGVGKTFLARRLAFALMAHKDPTRVQFVQFHQSYSYDDFVQGWRPSDRGGLELMPGIFYSFCVKAQQHPAEKFVFIIDEINRGNLSKIFGELLMLIEHDKRGPSFAIPLAYSQTPSETFFVPDNVYVIGMMNTADRSLAMVDHALRRRFASLRLTPAFERPGFGQMLLSRNAPTALVLRIIESMKALNERIVEDERHLGPGFEIGHSFFCPSADTPLDEQWYRNVIRFEVEPILREYWAESPDQFHEAMELLEG